MLKCVADYHGTIDPEQDVQGSFRAGEEVHVDEHVAAFLLRASPGSFERVEGPAVEGEETASGIPAADRRARGGRKR